MCAAAPRPNGVVRADQRSDPRHKTTTKISTPPLTVAISRWPSLHPRLAANHPPISRGPWPRTGATSKETCRETVHPGNQRRAGAVSDAHAAMAVQWQAAKMSFRLGQPEPVFFHKRRAHRQRNGGRGGRQRVPCFADAGWRRRPSWKGNHMKLLTSFRGSYSRNHVCQSPSPTIKLTRTGSRASLSAWSAPCGGSPIGLALPRNDLTKSPRLLRVPKRVVLSEYMDSWRNQ